MFGFEQLQLNGLRPSLSINKLGLTPKVLTNLCAKIRDAPYHGRVRLEDSPIDDPSSQNSEPYVPAKHTAEDPLF